MTDSNGVVSNLTYDALGRLKTETVDPTGVAALTSFDYDAVGQITKITRPNGAYLQYTWDDARRLTKVQDNTGASVEYESTLRRGLFDHRHGNQQFTLSRTIFSPGGRSALQLVPPLRSDARAVPAAGSDFQARSRSQHDTRSRVGSAVAQ